MRLFLTKACERNSNIRQSNKYTWTWKVKPECLDEYVKMHLSPWQEILDEHTKAGYLNYSIFQNGMIVFMDEVFYLK